jgi:hypothetical protein
MRIVKVLSRIYEVENGLALTPEERERCCPTLRTLIITVAGGAMLRFVSEPVRLPNAFISATRA